MSNLALIIPAYNEQKVIGKTLKSLNPIVDPNDIYVISDASTDDTGKIVKHFGVNYTRNRNRVGKTMNLKKAINKFDVIKRYKYVAFFDADTQPKKDFFKLALKRFNKDDVVCVCGQVESEAKENIFVSYRGLMYFIWQNYYKRIFSIFNAVTIAPGTSSIYRTSALKKIDFDEKIIIEDFDMTFQIHRKSLGKIIYEPKAKVITQDPDNIRDTFKQLTRWQLGFIQSAIKHKVPFGRQAFDFAIAIMLLQEIIHAVFLITLLAVFIWMKYFTLYPLLLGFYIHSSVVYKLIFFEIGLIWALSIVNILFTKKLNQIKYGPFLWLVQFVYIAAFLKALYLFVNRSIYGAWESPNRR